MCTVSFIEAGGKVIITSNRDEQIKRKTALPPQSYTIHGQEIIFPKDPKGGGTWFAIHPARQAVIVLLNGAKEAHIPKPPYRKSRGQIVLSLITENQSKLAWQSIDLENIEPFTIVLYEENTLTQLQWNGLQKTEQHLTKQSPHIWSSSTLYKKEIQEKRENWFNAFVQAGQLSSQNILDFHQFTQNDDLENGLKMNRDGNLQTLSICQVVLHQQEFFISYLDLIEQTKTEINVTKI